MRNEDQKSMEFEDEPVRKLLGGLKRVEAPGDFDFRVKARIAAGRPVDTATSWLPGAVRFAVPLSLLLLLGGYFGFNALYSPDKIDVQPVAEVKPTNIALAIDAPTDIVASSPVTEIAVTRPEVISSNTPEKTDSGLPKKLVLPTARSDRNSGGGSMDIASGIPHKPRGLAPPKDIERVAQFPAKDVLSQIGIDARYSRSSWTIGDVKPNSMAEHSGLKTGDVIEAINDQPLTEKTAFGNKFSGKSIRVRRDGKIMQIDLKP